MDDAQPITWPGMVPVGGWVFVPVGSGAAAEEKASSRKHRTAVEPRWVEARGAVRFSSL